MVKDTEWHERGVYWKGRLRGQITIGPLLGEIDFSIQDAYMRMFVPQSSSSWKKDL